MVLVATSLAAVAALQFGAADSDVDRVVLVLGVVDARRTLRQVLGTDLLAIPYADLPAEVVIERQRVDPRPIHREYDQVDWYDRQATVAALARVDGPVRINHEDGARFAVIQANVEGRDLAGFVQEAQGAVGSISTLPTVTSRMIATGPPSRCVPCRTASTTKTTS